jgi:hypothetical protein
MSQPNPIFEGSVTGGKLSLDDRERFLNYLYSLEGKRVQVRVEKEVRRRSLNQNQYYWGVVLKLIADHIGAETEEIHDALKYQFAAKRFIGNLVAPASTKRLDTIDFEAYLEKVRRWAVEELGVVIPLPNEVTV